MSVGSHWRESGLRRRSHSNSANSFLFRFGCRCFLFEGCRNSQAVNTGSLRLSHLPMRFLGTKGRVFPPLEILNPYRIASYRHYEFCELSTWFQFFFVCFRQSPATLYPGGDIGVIPFGKRPSGPFFPCVPFEARIFDEVAYAVQAVRPLDESV